MMKSEIKEKKLYFCPHCKVFFNDEKDYGNDGKKGFDYKCFDCSKYFNINTYKEEARNNQKFHFSNGEKGENEVKKHIQHIILDLTRRGYSQRKIYSLTYIPKGRIEEVTKERGGVVNITKKTFLLEYLQMEEKDYELLAKKRSWYFDPKVEDIIDKEVVKAINLGCTYEVVEKLFKIAPERISELKQSADIQIYKKYRINFIGDGNKMQLIEI